LGQQRTLLGVRFSQSGPSARRLIAAPDHTRALAQEYTTETLRSIEAMVAAPALRSALISDNARRILKLI
jgi:hypothetical protein